MLKLELLNAELRYDFSTGNLFKKGTGRLLPVDYEGFVSFFLPTEKKRVKMKASRLAWQLGNGKVLRKNQRIFHRNFDEQDLRLSNLVAVSLPVFNSLREAARNFNNELRLCPMENDAFDIVIYYYENRVRKKERFCDVVQAKKRLLALQLKYAKILTKYCLTN